MNISEAEAAVAIAEAAMNAGGSSYNLSVAIATLATLRYRATQAAAVPAAAPERAAYAASHPVVAPVARVSTGRRYSCGYPGCGRPGSGTCDECGRYTA